MSTVNKYSTQQEKIEFVTKEYEALFHEHCIEIIEMQVISKETNVKIDGGIIRKIEDGMLFVNFLIKYNGKTLQASTSGLLMRPIYFLKKRNWCLFLGIDVGVFNGIDQMTLIKEFKKYTMIQQ